MRRDDTNISQAKGKVRFFATVSQGIQRRLRIEILFLSVAAFLICKPAKEGWPCG